MAKIMENLINNKYYSTKEEVEQKLNVFFAFNVLTQEDYTKLMDLTNTMYSDTAAEETVTKE